MKRHHQRTTSHTQSTKLERTLLLLEIKSGLDTLHKPITEPTSGASDPNFLVRTYTTLDHERVTGGCPCHCTQVLGGSVNVWVSSCLLFVLMTVPVHHHTMRTTHSHSFTFVHVPSLHIIQIGMDHLRVSARSEEANVKLPSHFNGHVHW